MSCRAAIRIEGFLGGDERHNMVLRIAVFQFGSGVGVVGMQTPTKASKFVLRLIKPHARSSLSRNGICRLLKSGANIDRKSERAMSDGDVR